MRLFGTGKWPFREPTPSFVNCKWKLNFGFILESAVVRSEMEVVLQCENYVQVDSLTVVDFAMLYVVTRRLLLSSRVSFIFVIVIHNPSSPSHRGVLAIERIVQ